MSPVSTQLYGDIHYINVFWVEMCLVQGPFHSQFSLPVGSPRMYHQRSTLLAPVAILFIAGVFIMDIFNLHCEELKFEVQTSLECNHSAVIDRKILHFTTRAQHCLTHMYELNGPY